MILVVGATGLLGGEICHRLRAKQHAVRALVREGSAGASTLSGLGVEVVHGDLKDARSVDRAVRGASTVITTANAMLSKRRGDSLESVDRHGSLGLLSAAAAAGVGHFVFTSVSPSLPVNNPFVQYKREVESAIRATTMKWTILQPSAFMEVHAGPIAGWNFAAGRARLMGSGRAVLAYISSSDVAAFAVAAVENPPESGRAWHLVGPEPLSGLDAVAVAERVAGRPFSVQRLPIGVLQILRIAFRPFQPTLSSLFAMGVGMERGEPASTPLLFDDLGIRPTTFEEYVRRSLRTPSAPPGES